MFVDITTMKPRYGIKVIHKGEWVDAGDSNGRFGFDTPEERNAKRDELEGKEL
jgi:hypothetical protein